MFKIIVFFGKNRSLNSMYEISDEEGQPMLFENQGEAIKFADEEGIENYIVVPETAEIA